MFVGYFYSNMSGVNSLAFNVYLESFNGTTLDFLGKILPGTDHEIFYGNNSLFWNETGIYVNGKLIHLTTTDYLGLMNIWFIAFDVALVAVVIGLIILAYSIVAGRRKSRRIKELLEVNFCKIPESSFSTQDNSG